MKLKIFLIIISLMVTTACSTKKTICPKYKKLDKVPKISIKVRGGRIDRRDTQKVIKTLKALRVVEDYYWATL